MLAICILQLDTSSDTHTRRRQSPFFFDPVWRLIGVLLDPQRVRLNASVHIRQPAVACLRIRHGAHECAVDHQRCTVGSPADAARVRCLCAHVVRVHIGQIAGRGQLGQTSVSLDGEQTVVLQALGDYCAQVQLYSILIREI